MKRILSILLCALMVVAIIPMSVFMVSAEGEVTTLYDNEFDTAMNPNGGTQSNCQRQDDATNGLDGKIMFVSGGGSWTEPVALDNNSGEIVVEMRFYNNNFVSGTTLSINGVAVFGANESSHPLIGGNVVRESASAYRLNTLTITIEDLTTGVATVNWEDQYGNKATGNVTLGAISGSITLSMGTYPNSFKVDYVKVTQVLVENAGADTTEREEASYFYSSFNITGRWEAQGDLFAVPSVGATTSTAVSGGNTYMVVPTDAGSDTNAYGFGKNTVAYPANSVLSIDFMLDTLPGEGETFKFLKDRASWNNHIAVCGTANGTAYLYPNMGGAQSEKFYIEAGVWYTVQIFFGANEDTTLNAPVYAKKTTDSSFTYIGSTHSKVVGAQMNYDFVIEGSTLQYNVDNIRVDTRVDDIAVKVTGYQKTNVADGKYNVRFTAAIPELYAGQENVGFEIEAPDQSKSWDKSTTTVYNSLTANFGTETVNASDLGAKYVTAMAITGIPADLGTVELVVKPYVTINGVKFYGSAVTVTVNPVTE